ncbi:MAG: DUF2235 domain-containing protein [Pseudomonadota bacterium]
MTMIRRPRTHILLIDGTFSQLTAGRETNIGLIYRLLEEVGQTATQTVTYHPGVQGRGFRKWWHAALGIGLNDAIAEGYASIASRYRAGDRLVLLGYSRGAYAVRSLAGWIGRVGLLRARHATHRRVLRSFRYYEARSTSKAAEAFREKFCHDEVPIEMIGVFDTVKALGLPYPVLSRFAPMATDFHDHSLTPCIRHAFQVLAADETRLSYEPVYWRPDQHWPGALEQVWFPGGHADVGGQVWRQPEARALSNIPLAWMLDRLETCGVTLPLGLRDRIACDPAAPRLNPYTGWGKWFLFRGPRNIPPELNSSAHSSVSAREELIPGYVPSFTRS